MFGMRRREFITLLGGAVAAWPLTARAQQARVPTIGWLGGATPAAQSQWAIAFTQRLRMLGWSEGSTVVIEYRWAEGRPERFAEIAAEFVRLKVDVILAAGTEAALAAKQATAIIPIVTDRAGGAARATWGSTVQSGHAAAPPSSVMRSRRFIRSPRRRGRAASLAHRRRAPRFACVLFCARG